MDTGRESRWEKDAMTVEIVFAPVTAAVLAGVVPAVARTLVLALDLSGPAGKGVPLGAHRSVLWPECGLRYGCCSGSTSSAERAADVLSAVIVSRFRRGRGRCGRCRPSGWGWW